MWFNGRYTFCAIWGRLRLWQAVCCMIRKESDVEVSLVHWKIYFFSCFFQPFFVGGSKVSEYSGAAFDFRNPHISWKVLCCLLVSRKPPYHAAVLLYRKGFSQINSDKSVPECRKKQLETILGVLTAVKLPNWARGMNSSKELHWGL